MPSSSNRSLYFNNPVGRIWEEPEGFLYLDYLPGLREEVQFRALLTHTARAMSHRKWSKLLVDQRQMTLFTSSELHWMTTEWLPRMVSESGYRYGAVLVARDVFARLAMNQLMLASRNLTHTYRTFEAEAAARTWLQNPHE